MARTKHAPRGSKGLKKPIKAGLAPPVAKSSALATKRSKKVSSGDVVERKKRRNHPGTLAKRVHRRLTKEDNAADQILKFEPFKALLRRALEVPGPSGGRNGESLPPGIHECSLAKGVTSLLIDTTERAVNEVLQVAHLSRKYRHMASPNGVRMGIAPATVAMAIDVVGNNMDYDVMDIYKALPGSSKWVNVASRRREAREMHNRNVADLRRKRRAEIAAVAEQAKAERRAERELKRKAKAKAKAARERKRAEAAEAESASDEVAENEDNFEPEAEAALEEDSDDDDESE